MTEFWSGWVILLAVWTLGASLFLFVYGLLVDIPTQPDGTSGHVWAHGVLRESVRSLPVWWIVISATGFVAAFVYLALYPGFGAFKGFLGWTAHDELARDQAATPPARKRRCASASAARRSNPSPPTLRHCARAECCSSRTARRATADTGEATQRWALRISPTVTGSMAVTESRS